MNIFGPQAAFDLRYIRRESVKSKRGDVFVRQSKIVGYRNMTEFKNRVSPFILRMRAQDEEVDVDLPEIVTVVKHLEIGPEQRRYYTEARKGTISLFDQGQRVKARAHVHHMFQALDSTMAFNDPNPRSAKLDWLINELMPGGEGGTGGDLSQEKIVVFSRYKVTIEHAMQLFNKHGIKAYKYTGDQDTKERDEAIDAFWNDPDTRVLIGTTALERGLNLQRSAYMIGIDCLYNPRRLEQLLGRLRRIGSPYAKIRFIVLMIADSFEIKTYEKLSERAAIQDFVFEVESMFESLSDEDFRSLIEF
jgi:SNF2 family DNA or RNA helicase